MAPPTGWFLCCVCSMKPRVLSSRVVERGKGRLPSIWSRGMLMCLNSWIYGKIMAKRNSELGICFTGCGSRTSSCSGWKRTGSGLCSVRMKPLAYRMLLARISSDCMSSTRPKAKDVGSCRRRLCGSKLWNPKWRQGLRTCCTKMHVMRNRTRKISVPSGARISALRSYSSPPRMRSQSAIWRRLHCQLSSLRANLILHVLQMLSEWQRGTSTRSSTETTTRLKKRRGRIGSTVQSVSGYKAWQMPS
mmetsp:Transcript_998/g.2197  ORF Transcript_998/g.2197 Transcript_998/m.2197 type:complete len:247 (-) Transcript_998:1037-1777(-)